MMMHTNRTTQRTTTAQRAAATTKRWATAVAAAAYAVWVARLALGVYEAEAAARLRAVRPGVTVWHGAQRRDARAHTITDAQASPVFMMEACALGCAPPPGWQGSKPSQQQLQPRAARGDRAKAARPQRRLQRAPLDGADDSARGARVVRRRRRRGGSAPGAHWLALERLRRARARRARVGAPSPSARPGRTH